ncbi:hypothetical protein PMAYCL1PPCAC_09295, partial [Pristionchus mayeri]
QELLLHLTEEEQVTLAKMIGDNLGMHGVAYTLRRSLWRGVFLASFLTIAIIVSSSAAVFFAVQTLRMLSEKNSTISEKTRKLQRGLTIVLLFQLTLPLFLLIG